MMSIILLVHRAFVTNQLTKRIICANNEIMVCIFVVSMLKNLRLPDVSISTKDDQSAVLLAANYICYRCSAARTAASNKRRKYSLAFPIEAEGEESISSEKKEHETERVISTRLGVASLGRDKKGGKKAERREQRSCVRRRK